MKGSRAASVALLWIGTGASVQAATLNAEALHDMPGPVEVEVRGWDSDCTEVLNTTMVWADDDNSYGTESTTIPAGVDTLRFTFVNDVDGGTPDTDRNLFLDLFDVDGGTPTQGEDFDRTGGPDPTFPGCAVATVFGRDVADCGNQDDAVEYGPQCEFLQHCQGDCSVPPPPPPPPPPLATGGVPALGGWGVAVLVGSLAFVGRRAQRQRRRTEAE